MRDREQRPQDADWQAGRNAFPVLLDQVKPDVVLVLGKETWENLPDKQSGPGAMENHDRLRTGNDQWGVVYRRQDGGRTVAGFVYHPASPGWRAASWYPHVERLLEASREVLAG